MDWWEAALFGFFYFESVVSFLLPLQSQLAVEKDAAIENSAKREELLHTNTAALAALVVEARKRPPPEGSQKKPPWFGERVVDVGIFSGLLSLSLCLSIVTHSPQT